LLGEGCSNAEIATRLEMSYYTARNHTEQVLAKLGVSSRAAVGALLFGQG
jgi:DNA-binding CsgD family transcriptional regulator